jgi:hypothetical protein
VSVAGSTNLNGTTLWGVGDWAVFNGSIWQKVDGGDTGNFVNISVSGTANIATANVTTFVSGNVTITGGSENNLTYTNVSVLSGNVTANITVTNATNASATFATSSLPLVPAGYIQLQLANATVVKVPYYAA